MLQSILSHQWEASDGVPNEINWQSLSPYDKEHSLTYLLIKYSHEIRMLLSEKDGILCHQQQPTI
jgi:hypothetical protein